jgi:hypothetical protein
LCRKQNSELKGAAAIKRLKVRQLANTFLGKTSNKISFFQTNEVKDPFFKYQEKEK